LNRWINLCGRASDEVLKKQALSSITYKKFHAQGGSIYSLYPGAMFSEAIRFIVSFQTISDYLDNLCDRAGVLDEAAFRRLHLAMFDAVDLGGETHDYYFYYPYKCDASYLKSLVIECKNCIRNLPAYENIADPLKNYVQLYSDLQTFKHLAPELREKSLIKWSNSYLKEYPGIFCWEFSAATGSTLGIFLLFAAAYDPRLTKEEMNLIKDAYFPWVCGLHILLDYYIDSEEDLREGDLNFTGYYKSSKQCEERLKFFIENSFNKCKALRYPEFHFTVIRGLLAMYLSDPKASIGMKRLISRNLIKSGGLRATIYFHICKVLRVLKKL
jgi:tetraprenyl-beta-curcumene synthase